jgi:PAS domain S-box-containing protein
MDSSATMNPEQSPKLDACKVKILVVEDSLVDTELLLAILESAGYTRVTAIDDPRGVAALHATEQYDLILLDFDLPFIDGLGVIAELQQSYGGRTLPVLVITAHTDRDLRLRVLRAGAHDFIPKPLDSSEVLLRIRNALQLHTLHRQVSAQNLALRRREADLRAILDTMAEGVVTFDHHGRVLSFNHAAERLFSYPVDKVVGHSVALLMPDVRSLELKDAVSHDWPTEEFTKVGVARETMGRRGDGKQFPMELAVSELVRENNKIFVAICRDVSARRQADRALRQAKQELETRVQARTAELTEANRRLLCEIEMRKCTERELAVARDNALEASQLKSTFLANVSHEIRTPLNGMLGMLSLLLESGLQADQDDYARTAYHSGEQLLTLINEILDFSKVEAGRLELEALNYDLRQLVHEVVRLFDAQAARKRLEVAVLVAPEVPPAVVGDPGRVRQILGNLLSNAIKFTERGEVTVRVSVDEVADESVALRVEVKDTGIGIPRSQQRRIFDSFTQVDGSTTRKFGGTGLGLAICKRLVELMGGELGVDSEIDLGSRFWFTLRQRASAPVAAAQIAGELPDLRVLLVEDHGGKFLAIKRYLEALDVRFTVAQGARAMRTALLQGREAGQPFDVALLDVVGLETEGLESVVAVKNDARLAGTRIVLLAAGGLRGHARMAREAGVSAYITKPVNQERLRETLIAVMRPVSVPGSLLTRFDLRSGAAPRILVVEDNPVNQKVAAKILTKLGAQADVASDGQAAVVALEQRAYDLVFMDCLMPQMDGFQATRAIREREALRRQADGAPRRVPIIAMTANAAEADRQKCLGVGMDDFLAKPVTVDAVAGVLTKWLVRSSGH